MNQIHGKNRLGYSLSNISDTKINSFNPDKNTINPFSFYCATEGEIDAAVNKANIAFEAFRYCRPDQKAAFLKAIANEILALGDDLIQMVKLETALPEARVIGERGRTVNQLKLFASLLEEGSWVEATIDTAQPGRQPLAKPDLRKMLNPVGPVAIFTASNFPLAFSTAGGDSASALAVGNPIIIKAHESHLGTNELVSEAIINAAKKTNMPDGVFSSITGKDYKTGLSLVRHPMIKSVAFTGSGSGGRALYEAATSREELIPVFAEMGSINPAILLPEKLEKETEVIADMFAQSITLGVGQFCTNPGLIIGLDGQALDNFISNLAEKLNTSIPAPMLNRNIYEGYNKSKRQILEQDGIETIVNVVGGMEQNMGCAALAVVKGDNFVNSSSLQHEVFGPFSLVVKCDNAKQLEEVISQLKGQLTCSIIGSQGDFDNYYHIIKRSEEFAGRLVYNGVPTGVEVSYAMQHGGPYPASTDSRFTSVGVDAIKRFVRPVAYQNCPQSLLPLELKDNNPLNIWRKVNGALSKEPI